MIHSLMVPKSIQPLLFLCTLAFLLDIAFGDPPYRICDTSRSYENGSPFQNNLSNLLLSLPSNASISKSYTTFSGSGADRVYGLYMCLNYVSNETCQKCLTTAVGDIVKLCPQAKQAVVWEEICQLHYSNKNFIGMLNVTGNTGLGNKQNVSEPDKFESVVNEILTNLTERASFNVSANKYATGDVPFEDKTIYALVQCSNNLSTSDCNRCLQSAIRDIKGCCYASSGARVMSGSCYLRYEFYPFYLGASEPKGSSTGNDKGKNNSGKKWMIISIVIGVCLVMIVISISCLYYVKNKSRNGLEKIFGDSPFIDLGSLCAATKNFSDSNMLGQGGFGPVYKGILSDGQEVAIKRLSSCSEQGSEEFINEVLLIMKLQHKNLVKLLGFCVDGEEKLLVYEYLPNGSLDVVLFDPRQSARLDWTKRVNIINGIAKGILYLHEDSRLKIIHRDLKASNVLLDHDMNPKISDFGMARIFAGDAGEANTATIVGTYGYMAPEYAMEGLYSIKSDVFGFGVLLLEIITGKRNAGFYHSKSTPSLLAYAWSLWNEGKGMELVDPLLTESCPEDEFLRYMNIGLRCVQEDPYDRPSMSSIVLMLKNESVTLRQPERPPFSVGRFNDNEPDSEECSLNFITASDILLQCRSEDAMIWYEFCQVQYSFQMFFSRSVYTGKFPQHNDQEKNVSDPIRFERHMTYLMNNLSDEAAFNPAKNMFAAGGIGFLEKKTIIYGLVQCTRDMSGTDCSSCLSSALTELTTCCSRREGGIIVSRNCNVRFDLSKFFNTSSAYLLTYPTSKGGGKWKPWMFVLTICGSILILVVIVGLCTACLRRRNDRDRDEEKSERMILQDLVSPRHVSITQEGELISSDEMLFMTLATIKGATGDFSDTNKLGQGGFGEVYKGVLSDGNEIAVKRLSRKSWQGMEEFKNEIMLIAKLQHRNLVRLSGCVLEGDERILVYEFMSNKSLDQFIFDSEKRPRLDWKTCQGIINGIARGLVYLHEESRLKIIHRDLKPNNVLLDHELVAKISDFGMARIFSENQNAANTKRVVGTYGYMAPEYAMEGLFSVKSDVFSFGVILLEIISGKRNNGFYITKLSPTLLAHAWQLWNEGKESEFVDPLLLESCLASESEVLRCVHIGLLCVQQDPEDRPTMSDVVALLGSESMILPQPSQPGFPLRRVHHVDPSASTNPSVSEMMWSSVLPR